MTTQIAPATWKLYGFKPGGGIGLLVEAANEWLVAGAYKERVIAGRNGMYVRTPENAPVYPGWYDEKDPSAV